jgi:arsenate reductase
MKPAVLFLCTGNSARSQMAEGLLRKEAGEKFDVYSAGTSPKGIHPLTVQVMNEVGVDLTRHRSKHVSEYLGVLKVSHLIIVCDHANRECPTAWPGVFSRLVWLFDDPAACAGNEDERLAKFRTVRDQIHARINSWLEESRRD